jgi:hypothetical protein
MSTKAIIIAPPLNHRNPLERGTPLLRHQNTENLTESENAFQLRQNISPLLSQLMQQKDQVA